jgi:hypothetical protein
MLFSYLNGNSLELKISRDLLQLSCYSFEFSYPVSTLNGHYINLTVPFGAN